jgi:phage terminase small subunit
MPGEKALTLKQEKWCLVYLETGNASEAYRQAYDCQNMKPETIGRRAKELLDNSKIKAHLAELKETLDISPQRALKIYAKAIRMAEDKGDAATMKGLGDSIAKLAGMLDDKGVESVGAQIGALLTELERERKAKVTPAQDAALQELVDQAQELGLGYSTGSDKLTH